MKASRIWRRHNGESGHTARRRTHNRDTVIVVAGMHVVRLQIVVLLVAHFLKIVVFNVLETDMLGNFFENET